MRMLVIESETDAWCTMYASMYVVRTLYLQEHVHITFFTTMFL